MNNIPTQGEALICLDAAKLREALKRIDFLQLQMAGETASTDPEFILTAGEENPEPCFNEETTGKILGVLLLLPNGPSAMSRDFPGVVQTSNNIGVVEYESGTVTVICNPRSSMDSQKKLMADQMRILGELLQVEYETDSDYPPWEYTPVSPLRSLYVQEYHVRFGKKPKFLLLHGGLECGILAKKYQCTDTISIGPDILDVHSVRERVDIDSVERVWECLKAILAKWPLIF
jgi:dipeptidase D